LTHHPLARPFVHRPQAEHHRVASARDAGLAAFAATTGALLVFGRTRGGFLSAFADVGRHVMRDILLPYWGDALIGLGIHLGEMTLLGVATAALVAAWHQRARWRSSGVVVAVWELGSFFPPFAVVRPDVAAALSLAQQAGVAALLLVALALGARKS
jgi:hypothetical protein